MAVPKLRFKEFNQEWKNIVLEEVAQVERGKFSARPRNDPKYFNGNIPFVQTGDISNSDIFFEKYSQTLNELGLTVSKLFPPNTILITIAANIGDPAITKFSIACPDSIVGILVRENLSNVYFLKNILDLKKKTLDSQATQNTQKNINLQVLKPLEISIPTLDEQTKIANFLTAVDEKISQLNEQHQLMIQYKKGVMQKIFNQEIRFKDDNGGEFGEFGEFGEWEEKKLGKLCCITTGKLDANAMVENGKYRFYTCAKEFYHIDNFAFDSEALLISDNGANVGYIHYYNGKFNAYQRTYVLEKWTENIIYVKFFLEHFLKERINIGKNEGNTPYIVLSVLTEMPILLPCLNEQAKIADFITKLECKIENLSSQLNLAKEWKKGLLQQMFV